MIDARITQAWTHIGAHVHDISVSALALAVATLGVVLLMELRSVLRLRHVVDNQLGRIFEQLDLLSFETQQLLEARHAAQRPAGEDEEAATINAVIVGGTVAAAHRADSAAVVPANNAAPAVTTAPAAAPALVAQGAVPGRVYQNAAALAASGASSREIAERLGLANGEARLLSSLAQARARRTEGAGA